MKNLGAIAEEYAERGWPVFPLIDNGKLPRKNSNGFHDATIDLAQVETWWTASPLANIGIATGETSGVYVIDVDTPSAAHKSDGEKSLREAGIILPETAVAETPSGGRHYYFVCTTGAKPKQGANIMAPDGHRLAGVDVRATGGYIVAVGSVIDGKQYKWIHNADLAEFPEALKQTETPRAAVPAPSPLADHADAIRRASAYLAKMPEAISGQGGHNALMAAAGALTVGFLLDDESAANLLINEYNPRCVPPWTEKEIRHKVADSRKNSPRRAGDLLEAETPTTVVERGRGAESRLKLATTPTAQAADGATGSTPRQDKWRPNDYANTDLLHEILGEDFKYDSKRDIFRHFNGAYWQPVEEAESEIHEGIRLVAVRRTERAAELLREAASCGDKAQAEALRGEAERQSRYASQAEKLSAIKAMRELLPSCHGVTPPHSAWNKGIADLLPVANGLIDLRTGALLPPDRERLITAGSHLDYDPAATSERWETFLDEATGGDTELLDYLQMAAGYSVTARTDEQCIFVLQGGGETGKSLFLKSIANAIGTDDGLGRTIDPALFCKRFLGSRQPVNTIADLDGFRLVVGAETAATDSLDEELVKQVTGESKMNGRFLYGRPFEFSPVCKVWIATNHALHWNTNDGAMSRRIIEVPFDHRPAVRDPSLGRRFAKSRRDGGEAEAILAWLVKGAAKWYAYGSLRTRPRACLDLRAQSEVERDLVGAFISAKLEVNLLGVVTRPELNRLFAQYCQSNGRVCNALAKNELVERLEMAGAEMGNTKGNVTIRGITIKG